MQLVAKLEQQSGNSDGVCRVARQILDFFELHVGDYRMNQVLDNTCMVSAYCLGFVQLVKGRQDSIYTCTYRDKGERFWGGERGREREGERM